MISSERLYCVVSLSCLRHVGALFKHGIMDEVSKQLVPTLAVSKPASSFSLPRLKPVVTHRCGGGDHGRSVCLSCGDQHWTKSVPNPEAAQGSPKNQNQRAIFFLQGPYPLLALCFPLPMLLLSRAGSRKLPSKNPSAFNREGGNPVITSTFSQGEEQYTGLW